MTTIHPDTTYLPEASKCHDKQYHTMGVWGWIILYVLLFALLQFLLYRYLRNEEQTPMQSAPASFDPTGLDDRLDDRFEESTEDEQPDGDENNHQCRHCGAVNDSVYTYCRNCVNPLVV